jgi:hypothetical protein
MENIEAFKETIADLERKLAKNEKILKVLMDRVERSIASTGNAYALFENNIVLQGQVEQRTRALETANRELSDEIAKRRIAEEENETLIRELRKALSEVKVLSGMLPICSHCKNIRNDQGYWQKIESYIQEHSNAEFTHSLCHECLQKYYPDIYDEFKKVGKIK